MIFRTILVILKIETNNINNDCGPGPVDHDQGRQKKGKYENSTKRTQQIHVFFLSNAELTNHLQVPGRVT